MEVEQVIFSVIAILSVIVYLLRGAPDKLKKNEIVPSNTELSGAPFNIKIWTNLILKVANEAQIPADIIAAIIWVESSGNAKAVGTAGEIGLMQLKPGAVQDVMQLTNAKNVKNYRTDPLQNIRAGTYYFKLKLEENGGNITSALASYNQGTAGYRSGGKRKLLGDQYAAKVLEKVERIRE